MATLKERSEAEVKESPPLIQRDLLAIYEKMLLTRILDQRMWMLNRQGKVPFLVPAQGHEAAQVGSAYALKPGLDWVLPYYRDLGVVLTLGMTPLDVLLGLFARAADPSSGGRQMPMHWSRKDLRIVSGSSPVATHIIHAAGVALASKMRKDEAIAIVYFGDGATSRGDFHEGLNFAGVHKLPVLFFCENNGYAISTPLHKQMAIQNLADRAAAYGFPGSVVDGNDVLAVYQTTLQAVERARRGEGPTLIEAKTYRLLPHSSDDDDRSYRSREEVEHWRQKDPLPRFAAFLKERGILTRTQEQALEQRVTQEVDRAMELAEQSPVPDPATLYDHIYGS